MIKFKKKVTRALLVLFSALCLFIGPFSVDVKAANIKTGYGTATHVSYNWIYGEADAFLQLLGATVYVINIETDQVCTGIMTVTLSGVSNFADAGFIVEGAQINTTSLNQIQLKLNYAKVIKVYFISTQQYDPNSNGSITVSISSYVGYQSSEYYDKNIYSSVDSVESLLTSIRNAVDNPNGTNDILNYVTWIKSYTQAIDATLGQIDEDTYTTLYDCLYDWNSQTPFLNLIFDSLDEINTTVGNMSIPNYTSTLSSLFNICSSMDDSLSDLSDAMSDLSDSLSDVYDVLQQIEQNTFNVPFWQVPAFQWLSNISNDNHWSKSDINGMFYKMTQSTNTGQFQNAKAITWQTSKKFIIAFYTTAMINNYRVIFYNGPVSQQTFTINRHYGNQQSQYQSGLYLNYITFEPYSFTADTDLSQIYLEFDGTYFVYPLYVGYFDNMPAEVRSIMGVDDPYISLLQSINDAVSSLQNSQTVIDNSQTVINNYNSSMTTINNIEENILNNINNQLTNVSNSISDSAVTTSTPFADVVKGKNFVSYYLGQLFYIIPDAKFPIYMILILFVLLCMLG